MASIRMRVGAMTVTALVAVGLGSGVASANPNVNPSEGPTTGGTVVQVAPPPLRADVPTVSVSAGGEGSMAIASSGNTYFWGSPGFGSVDDIVRNPAAVSSPTPFSAISAGYDHRLAIGLDGKTYAWGLGDYGVLGTGDSNDQVDPVEVQVPDGVKFTQVSAGVEHSIALGDDGIVYAWGRNKSGQLGDDTLVNKSVPVAVHLPQGLEIVKISAGWDYSVVLTANSQIWAWGVLRDITGNKDDKAVKVPVQLQNPDDLSFADISAGTAHVALLSSDGEIYGFGQNLDGQLGIGATNKGAYVPTKAQTPAGVTFEKVTAGGGFSEALSSDGVIYAWGRSMSGELGIGTNERCAGPWDEYMCSTPTPIKAPTRVSFIDVDAGSTHSLAVGTNGLTYAWGLGPFNELGPNETLAFEPVVVPIGGGFSTPVVTGVTFGGVPAQIESTDPDGIVTVSTPAHRRGLVDVGIEYTVNGQPQLLYVYSDAFDYSTGPADVVRVSGPNRYETNLQLNKQQMKAGATVFVATGADFPDALSIGPAVSINGGSLVLTSPGSMRPEMLSLLAERVPTKIYVIGGSGAVSNNVMNQIQTATGLTPKRISGAGRVETSAAIFQEFFKDREVKTAFVATGREFPDALSAAAAGGALQAPVLLVNGKSGQSLNADMLTLLRSKHPESVQIVGGNGAVNTKIEDSLASEFSVGRLRGPDRYSTNLAVNDYVSSRTNSTRIAGIWLATGKDFPDALSAGVPAGLPDQRLVLSNGSCIMYPVVSSWINDASSRVGLVTLVGGSGALNQDVFKLTECKH